MNQALKSSSLIRNNIALKLRREFSHLFHRLTSEHCNSGTTTKDFFRRDLLWPENLAQDRCIAMLGDRMKGLKQGWQDRLNRDGPAREEALAELRLFLLKSVRSGLSGRPGSDDGFVEDVVQMALVRILDNIETFKGNSAFTTWALSIALRVAFTELRRKHWGNVSLDELRENAGSVDEEADPLPDPHRSAACNSFFSVVHRLIRTKLTDRQRDALTAELQAMPQDEIARQMGVTRNAVYKLGHDARRALKRALEQEGYGIEQVREVFD